MLSAKFCMTFPIHLLWRFYLELRGNIAEELAERERKKNNVVVYNLPEESNPTAEKDQFVKMCKEATDLDVNVQKLFRLGKKSDNKARPLLICLESEGEKYSQGQNYDSEGHTL